MTGEPHDPPTERHSAIQHARELSDQGHHDEALELLRTILGRYAEEDMQAKVDYLIALVERRKEEDPSGTLSAPDEDDPTATRRIPRVEL